MKNLFKRRIIDERMELQSLRSAKKSWCFMEFITIMITNIPRREKAD